MDDEEREAAEGHLELLDALVTAIDRRAEVLRLVEEAESVESAAAGLQELLGIGAIPAMAVLDLQVRRLTIDERDRITRSRDEVRDELSG